MYQNIKNQIDALDFYCGDFCLYTCNILDKIGDDVYMFDLSELHLLDVHYVESLQNLKEHLCSDSEMGGISLSQSLKRSLEHVEALESGACIQTAYWIDPELKKKINSEKIKKLIGLFNVLKDMKPGFDSYISRAFAYEAVLKYHLEHFDEFLYGEDNKKQFEMELEKTGFLIHSASLLYIGSLSLVEGLLNINHKLSYLGLWVAGSDFIENIDISFVGDDFVFGNDFFKNEYLLRSYLKESSDDAVIQYIEDGTVDEACVENSILMLNRFYKKYSLGLRI